MAATDDPQGYYRMLGLAPNASQAQILHAYREWAKKYHPDASGNRDASDFIRIKEAYDTLSDPARRLRYDQAGSRQADNPTSAPPKNPWQEPPPATATADPPPPPRMEPIKCADCGAVTAQPRFCVFYRVWSALVYSQMEKPHGVYCGYCARKRSIRHSAFTWLFGWWSGHGVFWTPLALWKNFRVGEKPKQANAHLLIHQGLYFAQDGHFDMANACFEQAKQFAQGEELDSVLAMQKALPTKEPRKIRNQWTLKPKTVCVHAAPIVVVICAAILFTSGLLNKVGAAISTPPDIRYVAVSQTPAWVPSGNKYTWAETLPQYTTLSVIGRSADPKFVVVNAPDGRTLTVAASALLPGNGQQAKLRWCSGHLQNSPSNGEVLKRTLYGPNRVTIKNLGSTDAVAQFRSSDGSIAVSLFVAANSVATDSNFPNGSFRLEFATGYNWSRACNLFVNDMAVQRFPDYDTFRSTPTTYHIETYTITPIPNGNVEPVPMNLAAFERGN